MTVGRTCEWLEKATIFQCEVGSGLHGIADGTPNDRDEMGICLEPYEVASALHHEFEQYVYRTAAEREGRGDAPSQPGDIDRVIYSLRKWARMALGGNPSVLLPLFAPASSIMVCDARGQQLRELAPAFASRQAGKRFLGYLQQQRQRMLGERGGAKVIRRHLVEQHGYDTKFAGHMLRLGIQGIEYLTTGRITLPMPEPWRSRVIAVRQGKVSQQDVLAEVEPLEAEVKRLIETSDLPEMPDVAAVDAFVRETYWKRWCATYGHEQNLKMARRFAGMADA